MPMRRPHRIAGPRKAREFIIQVWVANTEQWVKYDATPIYLSDAWDLMHMYKRDLPRRKFRLVEVLTKTE